MTILHDAHDALKASHKALADVLVGQFLKEVTDTVAQL
jgi:hypothetical protein